MEFFEEIQPWGTTKYSIADNSHVILETCKAKVNIFTNSYYGRMVFIDGVLQSTERDEKIYHDALVSFGLKGLKGLKDLKGPKGRVLIAGGAEGATAREVFEMASNVLKGVVMVDWDGELVSHMRGERFAKGAFENPLLELKIQDIMEYVSGDCGIFDSIIIDLLDPHSDEEVRWLASVCDKALERLAVDGSLVVNAGGDYSKMLDLMMILDEHVPDYKVILVPSFQEFWYLIRINKI